MYTAPQGSMIRSRARGRLLCMAPDAAARRRVRRVRGVCVCVAARQATQRAIIKRDRGFAKFLETQAHAPTCARAHSHPSSTLRDPLCFAY
eukprot:6110471-Pleurochrysis_carterae.AAC.2